MVSLGRSILIRGVERAIEFSAMAEALTPTSGRFRTVDNVPALPVRLGVSGPRALAVGQDNQILRYLGGQDPSHGIISGGRSEEHIEEYMPGCTVNWIRMIGDDAVIGTERRIPALAMYADIAGVESVSVRVADGSMHVSKRYADASDDDTEIDLTTGQASTLAGLIDSLDDIDVTAWALHDDEAASLTLEQTDPVLVNGPQGSERTLFRREHPVLYNRLSSDAQGQLRQNAWSRLLFRAEVMHVVPHGREWLLWQNAQGYEATGYTTQPYDTTSYISLVVMPLRHDKTELGYDARLDRRQMIRGTWDPVTGRTAFVTKSHPSTDRTRLVLGSGTLGRVLTPAAVSGDIVYFQGRYDEAEHYVGDTFQAYIDLPTLVAQTATGATAQKITVHQIVITVEQTADYTMQLRTPGRDTVTIPITTTIADVTPSDVPRVGSGSRKVIAGGSGETLSIRLLADSPGPCCWSEVEMLVSGGVLHGGAIELVDESIAGVPGNG
jgi:hypothetical protein